MTNEQQDYNALLIENNNLKRSIKTAEKINIITDGALTSCVNACIYHEDRANKYRIIAAFLLVWVLFLVVYIWIK